MALTDGECKKCFEKVLVGEYRIADSDKLMRVELDREMVEVFVPGEERLLRGVAYRRHRFTCEEKDAPDVAAADVQEKAADEAGEIKEGEA